MRLSSKLHIACAGVLLPGGIHRAMHEIVNLERLFVFLLTSAWDMLPPNKTHAAFYDNALMPKQAINEIKLK